MDADDEAVLNLIAECEWDLSNPPGSMSSSQQEQEASFQSSQGRLHLHGEGQRVQPFWEVDACWLQSPRRPFLQSLPLNVESS